MEGVTFKFENGKLLVGGAVGLDSDKDGLKSVELKVDLVLDAAEAIGEIFKKDVNWLNSLIATLGNK